MKTKFKYLPQSFIFLFLLLLILSPISASAKTQTFLGIDVSKNNGTVNWESVYEAGYQFAMLKTGDGKDTGNTDDIDPTFETNYTNAKLAGLECGVYHMIAGNTVADAKKEATYCLSIINNRPLDLPIAYDIETTKAFEESALFQTGKENITNMAIAFCETIKDAGYTPMIYTSAYVYNHYLDQSRLTEYKIWVAHHKTATPNISLPYHIWQFDTLSVPGANTSTGECDVNTAVESLTLTKTSYSLGKGEQLLLKPTLFTPFQDTSLSFSSSNPKIATISSTGKITAKKVGTTTITIKTLHHTKATCKITVKKTPSSISFLEKGKRISNKSLTIGQTYQLNYKLSSGSASNHITFSSNNSKVATVNANGKIVAKKSGTVTITAKTYNGKTTKLKVTIKKK